MAAPGSNEVDTGKRRRRHIGLAGKAESVVRSLPLIKPNAADLHAGLEGVTPMGPDDIVDQAIGGSDLDVRRIVVEANETARTHCERKCARLRIVEGRAVDIELRFVEEIRRERVL